MRRWISKLWIIPLFLFQCSELSAHLRPFESPLPTATYQYDGLTRPLLLTDASGNAVQTYVWANGLLVAQVETGSVRYAHFNELGHLLAFTDESGEVTDEFVYHPYGRLVARTGTTETPFAYMGAYGVMRAGYDLYLTRHRAYSANLMRFLQPDPSGLEGGWNLYQYGGGNPVFYIDALGLHKAESSYGFNEFVSESLRGQAYALQQVASWVGSAASAPDRLLDSVTGTTPDERLGMAASTRVPFDDMLVAGLGTLGKIGRVVTPTAKNPVIIGETMKRVKDFAKDLPGAKILDDMPNFKATGISDDQVTSAMMQYNRKWILDQMRSGQQIIDIGADANRANPSIFYQMEQNMLQNYKKLHPEFPGVVRP